MKRYHVFLGAPSFKDLKYPGKREWIEGSTTLELDDGPAISGKQGEEDMDLNEDSQMYWDQVGSIDDSALLEVEEGLANKEALAVASQRLSKLYEGVVFRDEDLETQYSHSQSAVHTHNSDEEQYEWSKSYVSDVEPSVTHSGQPPPVSSPPQESQSLGTSMDGTSYDTTRDSSDTSIRRLPTFRIPIHQLSSLKSLIRDGGRRASADPSKVTLLVGLLDVDGPDYVRIRKGVDRGMEIALLKLVMGSADGNVCKLTVWRELADSWGSSLRRGDVILLQDVLFTRQTDGSYACTASSNLKSKATVCYRTLPIMPADKQLRPDLRLAGLDAGIARVAQVVEWIQGACGITV